MKQKPTARKPETGSREKTQGAPIVDKFKCPCSKGWIVSEFDPRSRKKQRMTTLQCESCREHYVILNEESYNWTLVPRSFVE